MGSVQCISLLSKKEDILALLIQPFKKKGALGPHEYLHTYLSQLQNDYILIYIYESPKTQLFSKINYVFFGDGYKSERDKNLKKFS